MKQKRLMVGIIAGALVLSTATAAYAAQPNKSDLSAEQVRGEISTAVEGVGSFDGRDLPQGVQFAQKITEGDIEGDNIEQSISVDEVEGAPSFDEKDLPQGVQFAQKITEGDIEGDNIEQSIAVDEVEGAPSFDKTDLPEGVHFADKVSNSVDNGIMSNR